MHLEKLHALGNDFLVVLDRESRLELTETIVRRLCDRRRGVGADGVIWATPGDKAAVVTMKLFNADGSTAEMTGNGIRCLALAVLRAGWLDGRTVVVATDAGTRTVSLDDDGWLSVDMGQAIVEPRGAEVHVTVGNPHIVIMRAIGDDLDPAVAAASHPRVNLECVSLGPGPDELTLRVWERGVGETPACGTGACAAAAAAHALGLVGDRVTVHQPGGDVIVEVRGDGLTLRGPAEHVASVDVSWVDSPAEQITR